VDAVDAYAQAIREQLLNTNGVPLAKRKQWDPAGVSSLRR
jgi:hypothetical protein